MGEGDGEPLSLDDAEGLGDDDDVGLAVVDGLGPDVGVGDEPDPGVVVGDGPDRGVGPGPGVGRDLADPCTAITAGALLALALRPLSDRVTSTRARKSPASLYSCRAIELVCQPVDVLSPNSNRYFVPALAGTALAMKFTGCRARARAGFAERVTLRD